MNKKILVSMLAVVIVVFVHLAEARQPKKVPRIGYLSGTSSNPRREAFSQGLRELGYVEGKNVVIEWRYAEEKFNRLPELAAELVRLKVDVIVTGGPNSTRPAKEATATIPIVMAFDSDPVGSGFVASLAHPGGNITGFSNLAPELSGKQLELLKEIVPKLSRLAVLGNSTLAGNAQASKETELAAAALKVKLQYLAIGDPKYDIGTAFRTASKGRADAVLMMTSRVFVLQQTQITDLVAKSRIPAIAHGFGHHPIGTQQA